MSRCDGKCSIPSVEIGQVWSYCRDNLRGTTPLAQEQIDCLKRDYLAPSKAHIKRLHKKRPLVLLRPRPQPRNAVGDADIRGHNHAHGLGQASRLRNLRAAYGTAAGEALTAPPKPVTPIAFDYTRNATVPPKRDTFDHDYWVAEAARLEREHEAIMRREGRL